VEVKNQEEKVVNVREEKVASVIEEKAEDITIKLQRLNNA
jgi:hypothetical protein